jgi:calcineurin-like phosphoesterase family protein
MPLVLVHNDAVANPQHEWDDKEGVQYHYPAKYQSKIKTGETFVYYRGVHRVGGKRGAAEYVGAGRVGHIWPDPNADRKSRRAFYCGIEDYQRFAVPVPAKANGVTLEHIPADRQNLWRDGVRALDQNTYDQILQQGMESACLRLQRRSYRR